MKQKVTLVVLADDVGARFLVHEGPGKGLREVASMAVTDFEDIAVDYADRPGRQTGGPGGVARHGFDPHETVEEQARQRFSDHVIASLEREWQRLAPDHLILAAPPKMLGMLRPRIKGGLAEAPRTDMAKTLTGIPLQDLPSHFEDILRF